MNNSRPWSVYVNRMSRGEKYLFANISIPAQWIQPGKVDAPVDLAKLLDQWYGAWLSLHLDDEKDAR